MGLGTGKRRSFGRAEAPVELLSRRSESVGGKGAFGLEVRVDSNELTIAVGAESLADAISAALLAHHAKCIAEGKRPTGGAQRPLDPTGRAGKAARLGIRPDARGNTGLPSSLPNNLRRIAAPTSGKTVTIPAVAGIGPARAQTLQTMSEVGIGTGVPGQEKFVDAQEALGVDLFSVEGDADKVIDAAIAAYMAKVFDGARAKAKV